MNQILKYLHIDHTLYYAIVYRNNYTIPIILRFRFCSVFLSSVLVSRVCLGTISYNISNQNRQSSNHKFERLNQSDKNYCNIRNK